MLIRVGREVVWLWIAIESKGESSILVDEQFLQGLIEKYGKYLVSIDGL
jgi:hypothetical protein